MKYTKFLLGIACFSLLLNACKPGEDVIGSAKNTEYVNTWIMNTLQDVYYWNSKLPTKSDKSLHPEDYFNSIIYWYDPISAPDGDRFSWIEKDYTELQASLNGVVSKEIGFDMTIYYKDDLHNDLIGQINYVKKGTPAETSGLKRGMLFDKVNGTVLTVGNYGSLLTVTSANVTIGFVEPVYDTDGNVVNYVNLDPITLQTVSNYAENPVYLDKVITLSGHKVGYFVYHFFASDGGTNDFEYDLDLNDVFGRFKADGITDLVLDLRYNSGGSTSSAQLLASEMVPNIANNELFVYYRYNADLNAYYVNKYGSDVLKTYFTTKVLNDNDVAIGTVNNVGNQLGGKLYVLTGPYTASASEQIINGLKPFMDVVLIGDTTYGKNVASTTIYDENHTDKNKWGLQPIIAKFFNSIGQSDFTAGFAPNFAIREGGLHMKDFGDLNEPLLNKALNTILGTQTLPGVPKKVDRVQVDKLLRLPNGKVRGLNIDKLPVFE